MDDRFYTYSFEKLEVWQAARNFKKTIYQITRSFPKEEIFGLTSQIRRSVGSITSNLAEGSGRASDKERAHFTNIAYSSGLETIDHLITAFDLKYVSDEMYVELRIKLDEILNKLNSLYKYQIGRDENLKNLDK
ncbi:four helix bundle protein [Rhodohalobacter barkolensis]|uniref:Four helix bundle protein n=1 Tax=Rhodohalobacter barkolensis TaxID=2053187 RepID=A0A2N0VGI7_9BACT|nr:four helix bundle protein [Rhodohalobacter barkolensis]PKD43284.1 four helix bundle protein [Rhodohalobacter barkolensis]